MEERRLAAIMFTDIVGYTALAHKNEPLAMELLREHHRLLRSLFPKHDGKEIKTMGDAFLAEFDSALEVVLCAVEMQRTLFEYNASAPAERKIHIRIGIHLGDVIYHDGDILGDGVNIASRIEPLAGRGGICVSEQVYDQVRNKIDMPMVSLGKRNLKNVETPIEVYRIVLPWEKKSWSERSSSLVREQRTLLLAIAVLMIFILAGVYFLQGGVTPQSAILDKIRLVVLPLVNSDSDPQDEYFADGTTEELISTLSKIRSLEVIAPTSAMLYKETKKTITEIGHELRVGEILKGGVHKAGDQLGITVQLMDVQSGKTLWSRNYENEAFTHIFAIQSEIAEAVAQALKVPLPDAQKGQVEKEPTGNLEAHNLYLLGRYSWNQHEWNNAATYYEQALEKDPRFALADVGLAECYNALSKVVGPKESFPRAKAAAGKTLELDDSLAEAHVSMGIVKENYDWDWEGAEREYKRALELNPHYALAHYGYSVHLTNMGRLDEAMAENKQAQEIDPLADYINLHMGLLYHFARQYDQAIKQYQKVIEIYPGSVGAYVRLGFAYVQKTMYQEAIAEFESAMELEESSPAPIAALGYTYAVLGQKVEAEKRLNDLIEGSKKKYIPPYLIAQIYSGLDEKDPAFLWLQRAYEEHDLPLDLKVDPIWDNLRSDPRFTELLQRMGLEN